jgi:hypothetical protein
MKDWQVHAELEDGTKVVRYDRAGKWYLEGKRGGGFRFRERITFRRAVELVRRQHGSRIHTGLPGGSRFDAAVRDLKR